MIGKHFPLMDKWAYNLGICQHRVCIRDSSVLK